MRVLLAFLLFKNLSWLHSGKLAKTAVGSYFIIKGRTASSCSVMSSCPARIWNFRS